MAQRRPDEKSISEVVERVYWSEADARAVVTAWRQSGMRLARFAREHGVDRRRISRWEARLRAPSSTPVRFHPVRLVGARYADYSPDAIEVVLADGRRVRVPAGFAAENLARVLGVLEGEASC